MSRYHGGFETEDLSRGSSERNPLVVPDTDRLLDKMVVRAALGVAGLEYDVAVRT